MFTTYVISSTYIIKEIEKLVSCIYGNNARPGMLEEYEKSL